MRRVFLIVALLAAACGSKSSSPGGDPAGPTEGEDVTDDSGASLSEVAPELDALNTELNSIRDLPAEERDLEVCEATKSLRRMIDDLMGATPTGVDAAAWDAATDEMGQAVDDIRSGCPGNPDAIDAAFTRLIDALDALVEATERDATGPAA